MVYMRKRDTEEARRRAAKKAVRTEKRWIRRCDLKNPPTFIEEARRYMEGNSINKGGCEVDSRRSNFYDAEKHIQRGEQFEDIDEVRAYLDNVTSRGWFERRFKLGRVKLKEASGHATRAHARWRDNRIRLLPSHLHERIVLHELTHLLVRKPFAIHGRLFARVFLELVGWRMGGDTKKNLKEAYREENVKYMPKQEFALKEYRN